MRINHNISALNTYRQLNANNAAGAKSLEKLSSGLRINSAADDAAGLAISEKMKGQISGLDQAARNAQDGISLIQTAEGGLNETQSILQRMRELAVQSGNDTNTDSDRQQMQLEVNQLNSEITRISSATQFNTKNLLDGSMGSTITPTVTTATLQNLQATGTNMASDTYTLTMTATGTDTFSGFTSSLTGTLAGSDLSVHAGSQISYGNYSLAVTNYNGVSHTADLALTGPDGKVATYTGQDLTSNLSNVGGIDLSSANKITSNGVASFKLTSNNLDIDMSSVGSGSVNAAPVAAYAGQTLSVGGFQFSVKTNHGANGTVVTGALANQSIKFQIGANQNQNTSLSINNMSSAALGVNNIDISTQTGANAAISVIDTANNAVSTERANLGAMQNRLEHTINNLGTTSQNLTASESQISDVDMAQEMSEYTKNNILSQAATAMLAQANQAPQEVLQLLK